MKKLLEVLHGKMVRLASYGLLLLATLLILVLFPSLKQAGGAGAGLLSVFFAVMLLACASAASGRAGVLLFAFLALLVIEVVGGALARPLTPLEGSIQHAMRLLALSLMSFVLLRDIAHARAVTADTILGAVCVYLLIGMAFTQLYVLIDLHDPHAFRAATASASTRLDPHATLSYFSLVSLTTLGYGDVVPVSALARSLATLEAVAGQLYIAIIVARLVALGIASRGAREKIETA